MKRYLYLFLIIPFLLSCGTGGGTGSNNNGSGNGGDNSTGKTNPLCTSTSKLAKIRIKEDGIYRITYTNLYNSCLDLYGSDINTLKMINQGEEIAIEVIDNDSNGILSDADYIDFYGKAIPREDERFRYTDTNVYWLSIEDGTRKRIERISNNPQTTHPPQSFLKTIHMEEDTHYVQGISSYTSLTEHWYWGETFYTPDFICGNISPDDCTSDAAQRYFFQREYSFNTPHLDKTIPVNLKIHLQDVSGDHRIKVSINDNLIFDQTWNIQAPPDLEVPSIPADYLFEDGNNVLTIESAGGTNSIYDLFYLDWFEVSYYHTYQVEHDYLEFTAKDYIEVTDFVSKNINVYEISDHYNIHKIIPIKIDPTISTRFKVKFAGNADTNEKFIAVTDEKKKPPFSIESYVPVDLRAKSAASYIIVTHEDFYDAVIPLADYRTGQGHTVLTVKIDDVYNEFSYGIETPQAIKDFLTYAYNNWSTKYILLAGDATVDYKDVSGYGEDNHVKSYIPAYLYNYSGLGEVPSDNWFVDVDETNGILPEMIIGRIPAKYAEDITAVVNKIKAHEDTSNPLSNKILLIADDIRDETKNENPLPLAPEGEQIFEILSDKIAGMIPLDHDTPTLYQSEYYPGDTVFREKILSELNSGPLILNYTGHGSVDKWTKETVFSSEDIGLLQNKNNYPFVVTLNCLNGYFVLPDDNVTKDGEMQYPSIAETFLLSPEKGAVAVFAASAIGYPSEHDPLAEALYSEIFKEGVTVLGDAIKIARENVFSAGIAEGNNMEDVVQTFIFFGDPATRLK